MKLIIVLSYIFLISCTTPELGDLEAEFTIHGIAVKTDSKSLHIFDGSTEINFQTVRLGHYLLAQFEWTRNTKYQISDQVRTIEITSSSEASPLKITDVLLDNLDKSPEGNFPDADVAISSDNSLIAIGTFYGFIQVYSLLENKILWKKKLAEGMAKKCIFSSDNQFLFVGEQSIDANLYSFKANTGDLVWQKQLSNDIDQSPPSKGDNPYFMYSYPGIFHMEVDIQSNLIITAVHSWRIDGKSIKKSKLYSIQADGRINWEFPQQDPLNANIKYFDISKSFLVFNVDGFDSRNIANTIKENSINLIEINSGKLLDSKSIEAFSPYFNSVFFWQNVSVNEDAKFAGMATNDGRSFIFPIESDHFNAMRMKAPGQPIQINDIPLSAGIPYTINFSDAMLLSLTETSIPYSYSSANKIYDPPALHPMSGHLIALNSKSETVWDYYDKSIYSALSTDKKELWLMAVVDDKKVNREIGYFGFTLFKKDSVDFLKKVYRFQTASPVFFRGNISNNGLLKVIIEAPYKNEKGQLIQPDYKVSIVL